MSFFCGIYSRVGLTNPETRLLEAISPFVDNTKSKHIFSYNKVAILKCDMGAFLDRGCYQRENIGFCIVAGNPFLEKAKNPLYRNQQIQTIFESGLQGYWSPLTHCRGQFSMAMYNQQTHCLYLIADTNGTRPLYFYDDNKSVFFANSISSLSRLAGIDSQPDREAKVQKLTFGVPLGDRTENRKIKVLRNGEMLVCENGITKRQYYFRWDSLPEINTPEPQLGAELFDIFSKAVSIRSRSLEDINAFLSGGLDSRCVVAVLKKIGKTINSFNFSKPGEKDLHLAEAFAEAVNINFRPVLRPQKNWSWGGLMVDALQSARAAVGNKKTGFLVFSGDGGSVGLGRVYIKEEDISYLSKFGEIAFSKRFITDKKKMPPVSYLNDHKKEEVLASLTQSMARELSEIDCSDAGKKLFLFFLQNDQRRHLHNHYEDILTHGIELLVPFMDKRFCEAVVSAPAKLFLYHKFYHHWLNFFPVTTRSVPWQTYPDHLKCPVEGSSNRGVNQWESSKHEPWRVDRLQEALEMFRFSLTSNEWRQRSDVKFSRLYAACIAHAVGFGSYAYVFRFVKSL